MDYPFLAGKAIYPEALSTLEFRPFEEFSRPDKPLPLREFQFVVRETGHGLKFFCRPADMPDKRQWASS